MTLINLRCSVVQGVAPRRAREEQTLVGRGRAWSLHRTAPRVDMATIPIVDWRKLHTDRAGFLASLEHALGDIGFLCLTHAPRFEPEVQVRTRLRDGCQLVARPSSATPKE
jgi:hypothetical protein